MKKNIIILLIFVGLTVIMTLPLCFKFNSCIPGFSNTDEIYGKLWDFWRVKYSWKNQTSLSSINFIATPFGMDLRNKSVSYPIRTFINNFLAITTNKVFTYNFQILLSFILSAIFIYLFVHYLTKSMTAAFLSGVIYSFCPYHFVRIWQHLSLSQIQWIPLYIFSLCKIREKQTIGSVILVVLSLILVISFDYYYTYFMLIATLVFILYVLSFERKKRLRVINFIFLALFIVFVLTLPFNYVIFKNIISGTESKDISALLYIRQFQDLFEQSAKPLSYFLPASVHPIFGKFTERFIGSPLYGMSFTEHTLYLGWIPLVLAFVAFRRWRERRKDMQRRFLKNGDSPYSREDFYIGFFILLAIVAWLFSQPPWWKLGPLKIYLPSFFMYKILPMFRAYCRFGIVVMLAVSVLAGFGFKFILDKFKNQKTKIALTCLFSGLVLFEFWNWPPYKVIDVWRIPAVYYWLKEQPKDFVIAEYPLDIKGSNEVYKFYQTKHEKKIINGTIPGTYANRLAKTITRLSDLHTTGALKWMGVKYVLVHREDYLKTELIEEIEELDKISQNPGLRLIKTFPAQECPNKDVKCIEETGPIDVYEVIALPVKPEVEER